MKAISSLLMLAVLCVGAAQPAGAQQSDAGGSPQTGAAPLPSTPGGDLFGQTGIRKYLLGPGDVLDLRVFGEPQFSDKLQVTDEGFIEVPFLDPIPAKCRTDVEIKRDLVAALSKYLRNPQVSLRVTELRSRPPAVIFGAVRNPQRVAMNRPVRLLEALAHSGGVTDAAGGDIQVFHTEPVMCPLPGEEVVSQVGSDDPLAVPFTVYKIADLKAGKLDANPVVRPGDIVIVQEASPVYITGAVNSPTGIYLRDQLLLTRAIAMVGGLRRDAKSSAIRIYRQKPGTRQQEIMTVNFDDIRKQKREDFALQPYDVIEVLDNSGNIGVTLRNALLGGALGVGPGFMSALPLRIIY